MPLDPIMSYPQISAFSKISQDLGSNTIVFPKSETFFKSSFTFLCFIYLVFFITNLDNNLRGYFKNQKHLLHLLYYFVI